MQSGFGWVHLRSKSFVPERSLPAPPLSGIGWIHHSKLVKESISSVSTALTPAGWIRQSKVVSNALDSNRIRFPRLASDVGERFKEPQPSKGSGWVHHSRSDAKLLLTAKNRISDSSTSMSSSSPPRSLSVLPDSGLTLQ